MRLPTVHGTIKRRLLINFRVDAEVMQKHLPSPFRPKLHDGHAIAGMCLIRLENIRPRRFPAMMGLSSENAAHRCAVEWDDETGPCEGVYIARRDTGSLLNHLAGGRLFPGEHQRATFQVSDSEEHVALQMRSSDGQVAIDVAGRAADRLPTSSSFRSVDEASAFFEGGSLGYSSTSSGKRLDGLVLKTDSWKVEPLAMERARSTFFENPAMFPAGSVVFDCALIMRNLPHQWEAAQDLYI
jgi:hypothetical protein